MYISTMWILQQLDSDAHSIQYLPLNPSLLNCWHLDIGASEAIAPLQLFAQSHSRMSAHTCMNSWLRLL